MKHPVGINNAITAFIDGECHIFADTGSGSMSTTVHNTYDAYGNLASYKETATNYELDANIAYHDLQSKYIVSVPKHIAVKDKGGKVYRERSTQINDNGDITCITMHNGDKPSVYDMTYDAYGNLASLTKPENHKGQRMRYDYTYDDVPMLETRVTDALGRHAESYTDEKGRNRETVQHASGDNITVTKNRFTKHYFIGDKRIASKLGTGKFSNVYGISGNNVTVGQKDYAARMMQIEKQREEYYKSLGTPPGVPTMKGATADPDNTLKFSTNGELLNSGVGLKSISGMEIEAYKMQYSYDGTFPGNLGGRGLQGIDVHSVGGIMNDGKPVYPAINQYSIDLNKFSKQQKKLIEGGK